LKFKDLSKITFK